MTFIISYKRSGVFIVNFEHISQQVNVSWDVHSIFVMFPWETSPF